MSKNVKTWLRALLFHIVFSDQKTNLASFFIIIYQNGIEIYVRLKNTLEIIVGIYLLNYHCIIYCNNALYCEFKNQRKHYITLH